MTLLYKGAYKYPHQVPGKTARYLGWAVFRVKATQREVLFVTTHLDPYSKPVRVAQSVQFGVFSIGPSIRSSGVKNDTGLTCAGTLARK